MEAWKAASTEQTKWDRHLRGAETLRESSIGEDERDGGSGGDRGGAAVDEKDSAALEEGEIAVNGGMKAEQSPMRSAAAAHAGKEVDADGRACKGNAGIEKKDCRGKDLTAVLAAVRAHQNG